MEEKGPIQSHRKLCVLSNKVEFSLSCYLKFVDNGRKFYWLYVRKIMERKCLDGLYLRKKLCVVQLFSGR